MKTMRIVMSWTAVTLAALIALPVMAQPEEAAQFLKERHTAVDRALSKASKDKAGDALASEIDALLDYDTLSQKALSDHWDERSEADRTRFVGLLKALVERSYRKNLRSTKGYKIEYVGQEEASGGVVVHTLVKSKKKKRAPAVTIDYTMHKKSGRWQVLDITTDGVSMVRNYRSQFNRILRKNGWDELIRRMEERLGGDDSMI
jgi:phospholipid transport system substrate-binding protein